MSSSADASTDRGRKNNFVFASQSAQPPTDSTDIFSDCVREKQKCGIPSFTKRERHHDLHCTGLALSRCYTHPVPHARRTAGPMKMTVLTWFSSLCVLSPRPPELQNTHISARHTLTKDLLLTHTMVTSAHKTLIEVRIPLIPQLGGKQHCSNTKTQDVMFFMMMESQGSCMNMKKNTHNVSTKNIWRKDMLCPFIQI